MTHSPPEAGARLMQQLRAAFILEGTTYTAWCRAQGIDPSLVRQAVYGTWGGPKGRAVRAQVIRAAGLRG
ncbi:MAG: hypothetical protein JSR74_03460, partial [Proteobacteria bacterium]|nr:hypothetical protein [Pseudomonadota bacterium]